MKHDHPDFDRLTFGCAGCRERIERDRWASAPERVVHCRAVVPTYVATLNGAEIVWTYKMVARVPLDATVAEVQLHCEYDDGAAMSVGMPEGLDEDDMVNALATAEVSVIRVDPVPHPEPIEQPSLFGGAA